MMICIILRNWTSSASQMFITMLVQSELGTTHTEREREFC